MTEKLRSAKVAWSELRDKVVIKSNFHTQEELHAACRTSLKEISAYSQQKVLADTGLSPKEAERYLDLYWK